MHLFADDEKKLLEWILALIHGHQFLHVDFVSGSRKGVQYILIVVFDFFSFLSFKTCKDCFTRVVFCGLLEKFVSWSRALCYPQILDNLHHHNVINTGAYVVCVNVCVSCLFFFFVEIPDFTGGTVAVAFLL